MVQHGRGNGTTSKWVPTLFCAAAAVVKYFTLTLRYCTIAVQCEHFQRQRNKKHKKKSQPLPRRVNGPYGML